MIFFSLTYTSGIAGKRDGIVGYVEKDRSSNLGQRSLLRIAVFPFILLRNEKKARLLVRASTTNQKRLSIGKRMNHARFLRLDKDRVYQRLRT